MTTMRDGLVTWALGVVVILLAAAGLGWEVYTKLALIRAVGCVR